MNSSIDNIDYRTQLNSLIELAYSGELPIARFCEEFERIYNLKLNKNTLSPLEGEVFSELFDAVVWFSPYPEEREKIPNYLGEEKIRNVVEAAVYKLKNLSSLK